MLMPILNDAKYMNFSKMKQDEKNNDHDGYYRHCRYEINICTKQN
jgi:hypothetical protein